MSPRVKPKQKPPALNENWEHARNPSQAEFRCEAAKGELPRAFDEDAAFWKYLLTPAIPAPLGGAHYGLDREEHRVLSKASNAAGGYLVPTSLDDQITAARRARAVIGAISRELITGDGTTLLVPSTTTHGVATWTAENASYTASDEVFGQVSVGAFKGATQVIVSEELARDALADFEGYLSDELGVRIATLEETAFAVGDGSGKPLGVSTSGNGVATVTAATGSSTGFKLADVNAVWAALPDGYKPNASWIMSPSAFRSLAVLVDTAGGLVLPTLHAAEPTLFSRPCTSRPTCRPRLRTRAPSWSETSRSATSFAASAAWRSSGKRRSSRTQASSAIARSRGSTVV
jgi:HK97 family phage major capsid protein